MTTVRVARVKRRTPRGPVPDRFPTHVIVLTDDVGHRDLPIWLLGGTVTGSTIQARTLTNSPTCCCWRPVPT